MKLKEAINKIPDGDWIEFTEESRHRYKNYIGRVPKSFITGSILNYEVVEIGSPIKQRGLVIHQVLLKWQDKARRVK